jgi:hypothetical protein
MRIIYTLVAVLLIGATIFTFAIKEDKKSPASVTQSTGNAQTPAAAEGGLNPEHGQPGHRCDLPVGAPLNPAAASQNTPAQATKSTAGPVLPKTNPAHGLPGHRCDLAVGAPL